MVRSGFDPKTPYWYSSEGADHQAAMREVSKRPLNPPNIAGFYHPALQTFWERRGLKAKCLLVSESKAVSEYPTKVYPATSFFTTDLYLELQAARFGPSAAAPDMVWDVMDRPSSDFGLWDSIIAHALVEHVIDPARAISNMLACLTETGHLYLMTHTLSFHIHRIPRDHLRFNRDYWEDLPAHLWRVEKVSVTLTDLYIHNGVVLRLLQETFRLRLDGASSKAKVHIANEWRIFETRPERIARFALAGNPSYVPEALKAT